LVLGTIVRRNTAASNNWGISAAIVKPTGRAIIHAGQLRGEIEDCRAELSRLRQLDADARTVRQPDTVLD
jgi:hypothetical protein